ncbi:hypothetical protein NAP1_11463 [Erythrobacter sp. NAP1]|uniref:O-antigen ligase family protein n=1 Tax=Erythrobacter sp. NAP1 TaxID=237727 RepID=UPI00006877A1|nr:O-antigen ligase family protein [Erythrobacter sp. NAP1]EAQ28210.1 hypothetical protein NAP1_11463 [Erythrobacter sp. NAP1]
MNNTQRIRQPLPVRRPTAFSQKPDRSSVVRVGLATVLLYLILVPQQFNITLGSFYLSPYRIFLLGATIYLLTSALSKSLRFVWPDLFLILSIIWITLASYMTSGQLTTAMVQGGSHLVDIGLAYFLARATIQTPTDLRRFLILAAPGVAFTGVMVFAEAVSHQYIVQSLASAVTGNPGPARADVRLGFMRGMASFPHPILAGIFLASFVPIYMLSGLRGLPRFIGWAGSMFAAFTMSSAALLGLVVGLAMYAYDWLTERFYNLTWRLFLSFAGLAYVVIEFSSNTGFYGLLVRYASLNSVSAYNRVLIWKYGSQNVAENPWFGIGYADWDRPDWMHSDSFDWFWLIVALRFGIPATVFILAAAIMAIGMIAWKSRQMAPADSRLLRGVAISLGVFSLGLNSVSLWLTTLAWFFMLVGIAVSLGTYAPQQARPAGRRVMVWKPHPAGGAPTGQGPPVRA